MGRGRTGGTNADEVEAGVAKDDIAVTPLGVPMLAGHFRVLRLDMRGFGKSTWSPSKDYSTDAKLDDMRAIMADRGWKKIVPMVHSMTGRIGIVFAATYPELVEKLVVVDSATGSNRSAGEGGPLNAAPTIYKTIDDLMAAFVRNLSGGEA